ncbi:MAG: PilN domain-containing protein, partial [Candidatus Omnitrophica bacterium]|nr:PilN domain-containing protein [Candidatus Omnitrophota bacterium]
LIKRSFNLIEKTGFRLERVCLSSEALAYSLEKLFNVSTQNIPINLVHIDEISSDFLVIFKNRPFFIRSIPVGAVAFLSQEKEKAKQRFIEEIKRSLELYQTENLVGMPQQFLLTGAIENLGFLAKDLTEECGFPFKAVGYFKDITLSKKAESSLNLNKNVSLLGLIAPSLEKETALQIEFIPNEIRIRREIEQKTKDFLKTTAYILGIVILVFLNLILRMYSQISYLRLLEKKHFQLIKEAEPLEKDFSRLTLIKNYLSKQNFSLDALIELYKVIPEDVEISEIRFDIESRFILRGKSQALSSVFTLIDNLNKSNCFKEAKTKYTARRKEQNREIIEFEINANLKI